eukprot:TRINITY_DN67904_c0_g1_i1.p1 TRINITY_DN67904_c0_g1~~TRINITY_DN67904_c0_g1_i1.p1  ORF type:complete len:592 (+),score=104.50 TRINITY_DN67904_c0_g1_i1:123-1898(+)
MALSVLSLTVSSVCGGRRQHRCLAVASALWFASGQRWASGADVERPEVTLATTVLRLGEGHGVFSDGRYYVDLLVGSPPQRVALAVELSSSDIAFPCASGNEAVDVVNPFSFFIPNQSASLSWRSCVDACSGKCQEDRCTYARSNSVLVPAPISGTWFLDSAVLASSHFHGHGRSSFLRGHSYRLVSAGGGESLPMLGCDDRQRGLVGVLGLGPRSPKEAGATAAELGYTSAFEHSGGSGSFSLCVRSENDADLAIGGFSGKTLATSFVWLPALVLNGKYQLPLSKVEVGGRLAVTSFGQTSIDIGLVDTTFPRSAYDGLRNAIERHCAVGLRSGCGFPRGRCWYLTDGEAALSRFPTLSFAFGVGQAVVTWEPSSYLRHKGGQRYCYTFEDGGSVALESVLGASWMLRKEVLFEVQIGKIGVAPSSCLESAPKTGEGQVVQPPASAPGTPSATTQPAKKQTTSRTEADDVAVVEVFDDDFATTHIPIAPNDGASEEHSVIADGEEKHGDGGKGIVDNSFSESAFVWLGDTVARGGQWTFVGFFVLVFLFACRACSRPRGAQLRETLIMDEGHGQLEMHASPQQADDDDQE